MLQFIQQEDYRIVTDVMLRRYREYVRHKSEPRHLFQETMDPLSYMVGRTVRELTPFKISS